MEKPEIRVSGAALADICQRWRIVELSLFGSGLRSDFGPESDIDLLVVFDPAATWSTMDLVDLQAELKMLFGRPIDLVEKSTLRNPFRRRSILANLKVLYAA
ncbi:MAG: nucleotidyltransferase domain-containing protein [Phycisphaerae bacterium]|nr:nucleotidyltransferase domain-containing protein [Phycisphaerae bacterium]